MLGLPLAFSAPVVLVALVLLSALYLFLRVTPPRPSIAEFPPLRLLLGLDVSRATPAKTPWWLLLLRLFAAAAIVVAMAGPLWNPPPAGAGGKGPLLVVLDDGWTAAPTWDKRIAYVRERLAAADHAGRLTALLPVSRVGSDLNPENFAALDAKLRALTPAAFLPERAPALALAKAFASSHADADLLWVSDGVDAGGGSTFARELTSLAHSAAVKDQRGAIGVDAVENLAGALRVHVVRSDVGVPATGSLVARDAKGRPLGAAVFDFGVGLRAEADFTLPNELRNEAAGATIVGERSAGATFLLDERWRRRRVAIVSGAGAETSLPLLSPTYYLRRALSPFAEIREKQDGSQDPVAALIAEKPSVIALADMSVGPGPTHDALSRYVQEGGVLLRFAGTRLAASQDDLTPTPLRRGGRVLGGALSWDTPKHIQAFEKEGPFAGLAAPNEVVISRQVLAEPEPGLDAKTWARLADGTPLVTADRRGKGLVVLFHVTADTTWSNLPISGLFVDMLRRIVAEAGAPHGSDKDAQAAKGAAASLPPYRSLDGFGELLPPPPTAHGLPEDFVGAGDSAHPPGLYGRADALVAVNALAPDRDLRPIDFAALPVAAQGFDMAAALDLRPWLLAAAFLAFLVDAFVSAGLSGARASALAGRAAALALFAALTISAVGIQRAAAADAPISEREKEAALTPHLAYAVTGDAVVDDVSRRGLLALTHVLARRTSAAPGDPVGVDPEQDDLALYPLIYWPIAADRPQPSPGGKSRIAAYMKGGGTIIFDTRDALTAVPGGAPTTEALWLRQLLQGVDVPELEPVPVDHVVTKTFYLIERFVGRTDTGQTWIEVLPPADPDDRASRPARAGDAVSPIVIVANDLAAAWAIDDDGRPMFPLSPGGGRQREMALRGGVNLVMYALTGNYKADQVHARDLLLRLSH